MNNVFPSTVVHQTTEVYQSRISVRSKTIYLAVLMLFITILFALPFVYVDISVQSQGVFQSSFKRNNVLAPVSGKVEWVNIAENKEVRAGDVLAVIRSESVEIESKGLAERVKQIDNFIYDLKLLINETDSSPRLKSRLYKASYLEFEASMERLTSLQEKKARDFKRAQSLYRSNVIAFAEFDKVKLNYQQGMKDLELHWKKQKAQWNQELFRLEEEKVELQNKFNLLAEKKEQFQIHSSESGVLTAVGNIKPGDYVFSNQKLAEISPNGELMAYTYLSPADIAFIKQGQEVLFQVDAYDYNQWGLVSGKVKEVGRDISMRSNDSAGFLVVCELDQKSLMLQNGHIGTLKKGMTYNARFVVARRSLFNLLYDKADDWLDPYLNSM